MKLIKSNAVGAVALVLIQTACSGSGGGGGGSELATPLTFSGTVTVTPASLNPISPNKKNPHVLLTESPLQYAHVNVCRLTSDNKLEKIPGTSTVIAGTDGTFSLSIAAIHVPSNHIIVVCVSKPNGDWELFSVIPQDLLPVDFNEVTTVAIDVNSTSTILTRFLCSESLLAYSPSKGCTITNSEFQSLLTSFGSQIDTGGTSPVMSSLNSQWSSFFGTSGSPTPIRSALGTFGTSQGFAGSWFDDTLTSGGSGFTVPTGLISTTNPSGAWAGTWTASGPGSCAGLNGSWTATFSMSNGVISGSWSAPGFAAGTLSGSSSNGGLSFSVSGTGSASFSGAVNSTGLSISGSFTGDDCASEGNTVGSFSGGRQ